MFIYKSKILLLLLAFVFVSGCAEKIPVKEMALAKLEISRALSVGAKKYAPQEIGDAEKKLLESHDFVKQDALDKSKNSAIASRDKAIEAYNKSLPLLAKDTLDIAKQSLEQSEEVYAEVLAGSEYKQAKESYKEAVGLYEQKNYYACYEKSLEADKLAKEARNVALGKKDILNKAIAEVKATLQEAEKYNASTYAKDKVQVAKENLQVAEDSANSSQIKKGFTAVEIAGSNADEAYLIALKETAGLKIEKAEKLYTEAQTSESSANAKDELKGAKEALDQAKSLFQDSKYKESISLSDESVRLSYLAMNSMKDSAKDKIAGAELVFTQAKESAGAAIAAVQLKGAKDALDRSKTQYNESKYKEAIASAAESERLSNIVINTKGKGDKGIGAALTGAVVLSPEDYFIYKVRYMPEKRDCLWRIAGRYYSNPFLWTNIYKANTDKIRNPNLIWPNMLLKVPKLKKDSDKDKKKDTPAVEKTKEVVPAPEAVKEAPAPEEPKAVAPVPEAVKEAPAPEKTKEVVPALEAVKETPAPEQPKEVVPAPEVVSPKFSEPDAKEGSK